MVIAISLGIVGLGAFMGCVWVILRALRRRWYEFLGVLERVCETTPEVGEPGNGDLERRRVRYMKRLEGMMRTMQIGSRVSRI
jgi:hypothetical protein